MQSYTKLIKDLFDILSKYKSSSDEKREYAIYELESKLKDAEYEAKRIDAANKSWVRNIKFERVNFVFSLAPTIVAFCLIGWVVSINSKRADYKIEVEKLKIQIDSVNREVLNYDSAVNNLLLSRNVFMGGGPLGVDHVIFNYKVDSFDVAVSEGYYSKARTFLLRTGRSKRQ